MCDAQPPVRAARSMATQRIDVARRGVESVSCRHRPHGASSTGRRASSHRRGSDVGIPAKEYALDVTLSSSQTLDSAIDNEGETAVCRMQVAEAMVYLGRIS